MTTGSALHLHEDDLDAHVEGPGGQLITNLTPEQYAATWADGDLHPEVPANMAELMAAAAHRQAAANSERFGPRLLTSPLKWMPAYSFGGPYGAGMPLGVAVHSTEGPNGPGAAEAVAGPGWFGGSTAGTSAHKIVDQDSICEGVHRNTVAWALGPNGNGLYVSYEFSGYASWDAGTWRSAAQLNMLQIAAQHIADDLKAIGAPARWLSLAQVAGKQKGLLSHNDVRLALGGTTHSDPGPSFPYAELLGYVLSYMAPPPAPAPAPTPSRPPVAPWVLPAGQWLGNVTGGAKQHSGDPRYDSAQVRAMVQTAQRFLILHGCVSGQSNPMSGWADGIWGAPTDVAMTLWHQRFYPGQPNPTQCWVDDYRRLTA